MTPAFGRGNFTRFRAPAVNDTAAVAVLWSMDNVTEDIKYSLRTLRRSPILAVTAVVSLGLGIGANTAVFSFVNAIQFKALPFDAPGSLVDIEETSLTELCSGCSVGTSYATFQDWRARATSFESMGAYAEGRYVLSGVGGPERTGGAQVTAGLFRMLGVSPVLGREIDADDEGPGSSPVVVVGDRLWRERFAADAAILGQTVKIDGVVHTIVGVMPEGLAFPEYARFWMPVSPEVRDAPRSQRSLGVIGRLRDGTTAERAAAEMRALGDGIAAEHAATHARWTTKTRSLHASFTEETVAPSIVLLGAVGFVLLIACANVSNLLLVRASERQREIAIRAALGAGRRRIVRLLLMESALLAGAGGFAGLLIATWASGAVTAALGTEAPYWIQFGIEWQMFAFCALITMGSAIVAGVMPAFHASRVDPHQALKEDGAANTGRRGGRAAGALVTAQLALALLLLAGAGLLIKSVTQTFNTSAGYDTSRELVGDLALSDRRYDDPGQVRTFVARLLEEVRRRPGVQAGAFTTVFFRGFGAEGRRVKVEGIEDVPEDASPSFYRAITPGYFRMLGVTISEGREFTGHDAGGVALVDRAMADRIWPQSSALGQRIRFGDGPWLTILGVVGDRAVTRPRRGARPLAYVPFVSEPGRQIALSVVADNPTALVSEVRGAVAAIDPDQPIEDLMTTEAARARGAQPARFMALLMSSLSATAVALATIGLYGVVTFSVRRRLREIGIRLALGGTPRDIAVLIVRSAWRMTLPGLVLGLLGAWACTRLLEGVLFGTSPTDPVVFASVTLLLTCVTFGASWIPARRAARVEPLAVLRQL
jgi:putative ABC transport system permease protein